VPLDPAYPTERLAFMLKDADVPVLLTQTALVDRLPTHSARVLCLDDLGQEIEEAGDGPVESGVTPENLAYVIYTSGSTGTPKGALTTHRSMVKYAKVATLRFGIHPGDRFLQFCSISFDIGVEDLPLPHARRTLVLRTPGMLGSVPCSSSASTWPSASSACPTFWHEIAARLGNEVSALPPSLGLVIIGGEGAARASRTLERARWSLTAAAEYLQPHGGLRPVHRTI
jgi:non-ribosomal peptide synthetase component F